MAVKINLIFVIIMKVALTVFVVEKIIEKKK